MRPHDAPTVKSVVRVICGMNLGLMLPTYLERTERLTLAETADDLGIDAVFTGESASSNVFIDLTWLASHTTDVGLGVGIVNVFTRTPTLIAMSAAELDAISGGRLLLGFGSSTKPLIEGLHGMSFERPISRISEYVDIVRAGLTGERLDFDGAYYSPSGGRIREMPVQESVPIGIAALGPVNRRLTGRKADVWLPHLVPRSALAELSGDIDRAARESGRDAGAVDTYAYVPTALGAVLVTALAGAFVERTVAKPLRDADELTMLLATLGLFLAMQSGARLLFGTDTRTIAVPWNDVGIDVLGGYTLTLQRLLVPVVAVVVLVAFHLFINHTKTGMIIRATAEDKRIASTMGVNTDLYMLGTFALGTGMAGLAGAVVGPITFVTYTMGFWPTLVGFIIITIGGMGSYKGAIAGALLIGLTEGLIVITASLYHRIEPCR